MIVIKLTALFSPILFPSPPNISKVSHFYKDLTYTEVDEGSNLRLDCQSDFRTEVRLPSGKLIQGSYFTKDRMNVNDSGLYTCNCMDGVHSLVCRESSVYIFVKDNTGPRFLSIPQEKRTLQCTYASGRNILIPCRVDRHINPKKVELWNGTSRVDCSELQYDPRRGITLKMPQPNLNYRFICLLPMPPYDSIEFNVQINPSGISKNPECR